jgi:hypothetical protein
MYGFSVRRSLQGRPPSAAYIGLPGDHRQRLAARALTCDNATNLSMPGGPVARGEGNLTAARRFAVR